MNQGQRATNSGRKAEDMIAAILESNGYSFERQVLICKGIYGTEIYADFLLEAGPQFPQGLALESKWQDTSGSVDEKFPYLVANIRQCYPCPVIVIVHGGGVRLGAVEWLRDQIDDKLIDVFTLEKFLSQALRGFPSLSKLTPPNTNQGI